MKELVFAFAALIWTVMSCYSPSSSMHTGFISDNWEVDLKVAEKNMHEKIIKSLDEQIKEFNEAKEIRLAWWPDNMYYITIEGSRKELVVLASIEWLSCSQVMSYDYNKDWFDWRLFDTQTKDVNKDWKKFCLFVLPKF